MRAKKELWGIMSAEERKQWYQDSFKDLNIDFKELNIAERTQKPPSEEHIERLNRMASEPPFCWTRKYKDQLPR
ncbi:MAG TPA: hypothetical protein VK711_15180 [Puia sp.]|jgi:hypothetical protein|nr:hypothetical protein [Puia sp.]